MNCPKCGHEKWHGPFYMKDTDVLVYRCAQCCYSREELPLDRKTAPPDDMADLLRDYQAWRDAVRWPWPGLRWPLCSRCWRPLPQGAFEVHRCWGRG